MKTTKDIAELFFAELERAAKGDVRKEVIGAMEKCSNSLIKLARLEMDFAFRNWGDQPPQVSWITTRPLGAMRELPTENQLPIPKASTARGQQIEKEIENARKQLTTANGTMKTILTDKINLLQNKLERAEAQRDGENEVG